MVAGLAVLAGCPDDPYKAETWTKKLKDQRESERAVTELQQLGNPSAIPALGDAWVDQGKPVRLLQVIISLARPLTPKEAEANFYTDYTAAGRPPSWDRALPYLKRALSEVDEANSRSVDSAANAADALGEAKLPDGLDALIELVQRPVTKKLIKAQIAALGAIGKYTADSQRASAALI
jgi:HEAT repeat protein